MRGSTIMMLAGIALAAPTLTQAQVVVGTTATEQRQIALGWSAHKQVLGQAVYNDTDEKIGTIDDVIIGPDKSVSYAIIGTGGFLNMGKHDVAIRVNRLKQTGGKFVLAGATKDVLKNMPAFEYKH